MPPPVLLDWIFWIRRSGTVLRQQRPGRPWSSKKQCLGGRVALRASCRGSCRCRRFRSFFEAAAGAGAGGLTNSPGGMSGEFGSSLTSSVTSLVLEAAGAGAPFSTSLPTVTELRWSRRNAGTPSLAFAVAIADATLPQGIALDRPTAPTDSTVSTVVRRRRLSGGRGSGTRTFTSSAV